MTEQPYLPLHIPAEQIEKYLDRIALAIAHAEDPQPILIWYEFLEKELELRRRSQATLCSALERAKRWQDQ